ncbi:hypothetical protein NP233_g8751 [Leucocoprinus birnbaumii]|uniref:Uncharacterized protein n=1 Tax=Leucocoprinus birnbaumii TaxID=56174 RepID=A0AAD5VQ84_9AGAR|nr:hypothetical protein NP233_g8751 [Leucocoprinus birnbaumii]
MGQRASNNPRTQFLSYGASNPDSDPSLCVNYSSPWLGRLLLRFEDQVRQDMEKTRDPTAPAAVGQPTPMTEMIVPSSNGGPSAVEEAQPENKGLEQETTGAQKVDHEVAKGEEQSVSPPT